MPNLIGKTLAGRYRIDESLGRGGMAEVYKVWDEQRAAYLAMKVLREDLAEDKVFIRRFKREAQTLSRLQHPNIVRFYGLDEDKENDVVFMLMDYVEDTTLRKEIYKSKQPFTAERVLEVLRPVCSALHYAHAQGIVHCDVKPGNIMIDTQGHVLLSDFGIARMTDAATATMIGAGTPAYMAPEQIRGEEPVPQTDIYALGVILFEMLTGGERPFEGEHAKTTGSTGEKLRWEQLNLNPPSPRKFNSTISPALEAVIMKCLQKEPAKRQRNVLELFSELTLVIQPSESIPNNPPSKALETDKAQPQVIPQKSPVREEYLQEQVVRSSIARAEALVEMSKLDQAIQELEQAYKIKPKLVAEHLVAALRNRGEWEAAQGKIQEARSYYRQAANIAAPGSLRDDLLNRIDSLIKIPASHTLKCPTCGKAVESNWVACPYCKSRLNFVAPAKEQSAGLSISFATTQQAVPSTNKAVQLPAVWFGYILILALCGFAVLQSIDSIAPSVGAFLMLFLGTAASIYWFVCLYQLHRALQRLTNASYPITPWKSVGFHFIPVYGFYWFFKWSNGLIVLTQNEARPKLRKGGMGLLLFIGFLIISIAYSVVTASALAGLILLALGLLAIFSVLEYFSNELLRIYGPNVQENRGKWWASRVSQFVDEYSLIFWMAATIAVLLLTFFLVNSSGVGPIWLLLAMGLFQQLVLQSKKQIVVWWAVCWILGVGSAVLLIALIQVLMPSINTSANSAQIIFMTLLGGCIGLYQWLILRKNQVKSAAWWILVSAVSGLAFAPISNQESNSYLFILSALAYGVVTGFALEWILERQIEPSQNVGKFLAGMPAMTKAITAIVLFLTLSFAFQAWQTRRVEDVSIQVPANAYWTSTGLNLSPGNRIAVRYVSGNWSIDPNNTEDGRYTDANGVQNSTPNKYCTTCDAPNPSGALGMLYARQDTFSGNFAVGDYSTFTAQQPGILYLMINDNYNALGDNTGSIIVEIQVYNR